MSNEISPEKIREFVIAGHGNLKRVQELLIENPDLLNAGYRWNDNDIETAIQGAAQVGNRPIAEYLLQRGAPLHICTAAMLGRRDQVKKWLDADPSQIDATGAHGIPLLPHAVFGNDLELLRLVHAKGARKGANLALHNAVLVGNFEIVEWLVKNASPDVNSKNFQGKTPLQVAHERNHESISKLLQANGASQ